MYFFENTVAEFGAVWNEGEGVYLHVKEKKKKKLLQVNFLNFKLSLCKLKVEKVGLSDSSCAKCSLTHRGYDNVVRSLTTDILMSYVRHNFLFFWYSAYDFKTVVLSSLVGTLVSAVFAACFCMYV